MLKGLGIDIIEVKKIEEMLKNYGPLTGIFTEKEINYCEKTINKYQHFAGRFASKESVIKAISSSGTIIEHKFNDIEIVNDNYGKPVVLLSGNYKKLAKKMRIKQINLSISHITEYVIAVVILL